MSNKNCDLSSERVVLSSLIQYGYKVYPDVDVLLKSDDFHLDSNRALYSVLKSILTQQDLKSITIDNILTVAKELNLNKLLEDKIDTLKIYQDSLINIDELPKFVKNVKFWSIQRGLTKRLKLRLKQLEDCSGQETVTQIVGDTEETIFDFIPEILDEQEIVEMGDYVQEYITYLGNEPVEIAGLPTGFPNYDYSIGGGLRRGSVNVLGARPKVGKSTWCLNIAKNLAEQGIPILYLDTELRKEVQAIRWTALNSGVDQNLIETGQFMNKDNYKDQVQGTLEKIKDYPFDHINISGKSVEEYLSITRRWISKKVGRDSNGKIKDCLIILDYLKLMDINELGGHQEYQFLGDTITKLHNFSVKYDVPIYTAVQLNRDGINREDTAAVSASDRIVWLCSSLTFLKRKTSEDYASGDPESNGDRKAIVIETRYGKGMDITSEYINIQSKLDRCEFIEGKFNHEILKDERSLTEVYEDDETIDF